MSFIRGTAAHAYIPGAILTTSETLYMLTSNVEEDIWFEPHQTFTVIDCRPNDQDNLTWWVTAAISGLGVRTCLVYTNDFRVA